MKLKRIAFKQSDLPDYLFYQWCVANGFDGTAEAIKTNTLENERGD